MSPRILGSVLLALVVAGMAGYFWPGTETALQLRLPVPSAPAPLQLAAPAPSLSSVFLPVSLPISVIRDRLNRGLPSTFAGAKGDPIHHKAVTDDSLQWVAHRGPIDVGALDGRLRLGVHAAGDATVSGKFRPVRGTVGKILRRALGGESGLPFNVRTDVVATLTATMQPELLPDWRVKANIASRVDVQKAEVPIGGITRVSVRSQVKAALEKEVRGQLGRLEKRILDDDHLRRLASREWKRLHKVERLFEQPATWLVVRPVRIEATKISIGQHDVSLGLGIQAETSVLVSEHRPVNPPVELPPLGHADAREGMLKLNTLGIAPWQQLSSVLSRQLKQDSVQGGDGTVLHIRDAELAPWGDDLLLTLDIEAERGRLYRASGRLYLTARPRLDVRQQRLYLDDLDFALETRDALAAMAAWMMRPTILEALQTRATLDLSEYVTRARIEAERAIERFIADMPQGIELSAGLQELAITGLQVNPEALQVMARASVRTEASLSRLTFAPALD